jgi:hypothetical protein
MQNRRKQDGMTFISWLVILAVFGFFILVGLKVTPVYLENFAIKKSLESLQNEPLLGRKTVREIRKLLMRRLDLNSIYDMTKDEVIIKRQGSITKITIKYEERRPIVGNMSIVMTFEDSIEVDSN